MFALDRAVSFLILLIPLSCAGPLEESGAFQAGSDVPAVPAVDRPLVARRAPGERPLDVSQREVAQALLLLSSQFDRLAADPDLARRRLLAEVELPPELEGLLLDRALEGRVVLASAELPEPQQKQMTEAYFRHRQETHGRWGDCLNVMDGARYLTSKARYRLACHFALASVWDGMKDELGGMLDPERIESGIIVGLATWAVQVVIPEPFDKLRELGREIATPGTRLNDLVTRGCGKGR